MARDWESTTVENKPLVLDFVEWVARGPRSRDDVMEAWRTSCPRLQIWEDAVDLRLVQEVSGAQKTVCVTPVGRSFLLAHGRDCDAG